MHPGVDTVTFESRVRAGTRAVVTSVSRARNIFESERWISFGMIFEAIRPFGVIFRIQQAVAKETLSIASEC